LQDGDKKKEKMREIFISLLFAVKKKKKRKKPDVNGGDRKQKMKKVKSNWHHICRIGK